MKNRGRDLFFKYKVLINMGIGFYSFFPKKIRFMLLNHIVDKKGVIRMAQRYMILKTIAISVGDNVSIHDHVYLLHPEQMKFGNNVSIHPMCYLQGSGGITIGNDVSIAHGVTIMTENHGYNNLESPIKDQDIEKQNIIIEDNVWIGAKATILYGRTIGSGSIIGAGAVITKDVLKGDIVGGIPAKIIKSRYKELENK